MTTTAFTIGYIILTLFVTTLVWYIWDDIIGTILEIRNTAYMNLSGVDYRQNDPTLDMYNTTFKYLPIIITVMAFLAGYIIQVRRRARAILGGDGVE